MELSLLIVPAYLTALIAVVGWMLKGRLDRIERAMDAIKEAEAKCRLDNSREFSTWAEFNKLAGTVTTHGERISRLEAREGRCSRVAESPGGGLT